MKFCQIIAYPDSLLNSLHAARPHLMDAPFKEHAPELAIEAPVAADLWTTTLTDSGHESQLIVANDVVSQCKWAAEKLETFKPRNKAEWMCELVLEQLRKVKPDVLCLTAPISFQQRLLEHLKHRPRHLIAWTGGAPMAKAPWKDFDLVIAPHEAGVRNAWKNGARDARVLRPGFPRAVAEAVFQEPIVYDVAYVGPWDPAEEKRNKRIAALAKAAQRKDLPFKLGLFLEVPAGADVPPAVLKLNQGPRLGLARYKALSSAKLVVSEESPAAEAGSLSHTVFEGPGLGVCTLAPASDLLETCFKPGTEIVAYSNGTDLIARIDEYLAADAKRTSIAKAGQERCLTEHSLEARMKELLAMLENPPGKLSGLMRRVWHGTLGQG